MGERRLGGPDTARCFFLTEKCGGKEGSIDAGKEMLFLDGLHSPSEELDHGTVFLLPDSPSEISSFSFFGVGSLWSVDRWAFAHRTSLFLPFLQ